MPCVGCEKECKCTAEKCSENCKCGSPGKCGCNASKESCPTGGCCKKASDDGKTQKTCCKGGAKK